VPLQDGIYFSAAARAERAPPPPYHIVRVWGTFGYILPSVVLYFFLTGAGSVAPALVCGVAMCALGAINALLVLPADTVALDRSKAAPTRLPTLKAARAMLEPHVLVFCIAMALVHMAAASYYQLYPLHLTDNLTIGKQWVGLIANIGVVVEIGFMLGFGWLTARLTLRGLMIVGVGCIALRFVLLALVPTPAIAIGTQALHGMMVLVLHVAPPIYLNGRARDAYRNSIQGLYAMLVSGAARIIGSAVAGIIAERSIAMAFAGAAGLSVIATGLFWFAFREEPARAEPEAQPLDAPAAV
jgi:PPP family 3-phenylpropionic acid transporter